MAHPDIGREMLERMAEELRDIATIEQRPLMEGRKMSLLLAPSAKAKAQRERPPAPQTQSQLTRPPEQAGDTARARPEESA
jgi:translation initiation factor IF-3